MIKQLSLLATSHSELLDSAIEFEAAALSRLQGIRLKKLRLSFPYNPYLE